MTRCELEHVLTARTNRAAIAIRGQMESGMSSEQAIINCMADLLCFIRWGGWGNEIDRIVAEAERRADAAIRNEWGDEVAKPVAEPAAGQAIDVFA